MPATGNLLKKLILALVLAAQTIALPTGASAEQEAALAPTPEPTKSFGSNTPGYFKYQYSETMMTYRDIQAWTSNGKIYLEDSSYLRNISLFAEADEDFFVRLAEVIDKNQIDKWDGFDKFQKDVLDSESFSLDLTCGNQSIHAKGYGLGSDGFQPENYEEGHAALISFLQECESYLRPITPTFDTLSEITVGDGRFTMSLEFASAAPKSLTIYDMSDVNWYSNGHVFKASDVSETKAQDSIEFNTDVIAELFHKATGLEMSGRNYSPNDENYVALSYKGGKDGLTYYGCFAQLSEEDRQWFTQNMLETIGLPADFNFNILFAEQQ